MPDEEDFNEYDDEAEEEKEEIPEDDEDMKIVEEDGADENDGPSREDPSDLLKASPADLKISTLQMNKIISHDDTTVTVQSGVLIRNLCEYLEKRYLTLDYVPEYIHVCVGSALFTPIHGSSCDYYSFADLITSYKYIERSTLKFKEVVVFRNEEISDVPYDRVPYVLRIKHTPLYKLYKKITFEDDRILEDLEKVQNLFTKNHSVVIQWYFNKKQVMIWKLNKTNQKIKKQRYFYRHGDTNYYWYKYVSAADFVDTNWRLQGLVNLNHSTKLIKHILKFSKMYVFEVRVDVNNFNEMIKFLRKRTKLIKSIAIRYSKHNYYWFDIVVHVNNKNVIPIIKRKFPSVLFHCGKNTR